MRIIYLCVGSIQKRKIYNLLNGGPNLTFQERIIDYSSLLFKCKRSALHGGIKNNCQVQANEQFRKERSSVQNDFITNRTLQRSNTSEERFNLEH